MAGEFTFPDNFIEGRLMKLPHRRQFLHLAAGAIAAPTISRIAKADAYPTRPVRIVVGSAPAGGTDIFARLIGQWLSERLGQPFIIENRPGAGSNIATEAVVRAPPDGYTLLMFDAGQAINATLYERLNYNFIRDVAPVIYVLRAPLVMLVNPSVPAKTVPEFLSYAKANPGKINMASAGPGSPPHMTGELFKMMAGIDIVPVHYRGGGPAVSDLIGGQVQVLFIPLPAVSEHIKAGKLRALAATSATPTQTLPGLPSVSEFLPNFEASNWYGLGAPKNTPADIVSWLNKEINAGIADPKLRARLAEFGGMPVPNAPAEFARLIADDIEKWGNVVRFAGLKPD
jgi:tripartite-type tricarboxylate transporter receptor subunit TctC